jgi:hypothetical protein
MQFNTQRKTTEMNTWSLQCQISLQQLCWLLHMVSHPCRVCRHRHCSNSIYWSLQTFMINYENLCLLWLWGNLLRLMWQFKKYLWSRKCQFAWGREIIIGRWEIISALRRWGGVVKWGKDFQIQARIEEAQNWLSSRSLDLHSNLIQHLTCLGFQWVCCKVSTEWIHCLVSSTGIP